MLCSWNKSGGVWRKHCMYSVMANSRLKWRQTREKSSIQPKSLLSYAIRLVSQWKFIYLFFQSSVATFWKLDRKACLGLNNTAPSSSRKIVVGCPHTFDEPLLLQDILYYGLIAYIMWGFGECGFDFQIKVIIYAGYPNPFKLMSVNS